MMASAPRSPLRRGRLGRLPPRPKSPSLLSPSLDTSSSDVSVYLAGRLGRWDIHTGGQHANLRVQAGNMYIDDGAQRLADYFMQRLTDNSK